MSFRSIFLLLLPIAFSGVPARADDPPSTDFFESKIRPVLVAECYKCHSAQSEKLKAGFKLDTREGLLKGGESGKPAILPGDPDQSPLIQAIRYTNPDFQMPPKKQLPAPVVKDFEAWVRAGAPDPRAASAAVAQLKDPKSHWAFQPVRDVAIPKVKDAAWVRTPIDHFILAKLEASNLHPAPPADRRTLIRRVYYDLTGLPPTFEEVEAFEHDQSPDACEKVIDRLLASPRYGERWGRYWLDLARYADTKGYVYADREDPRFVHSHNYRDWVIAAFNADMPYDRFLIEQIAADQVGSGFRVQGSANANASASANPDPNLAAMGFLTVGRRFLGVVHDIIDDRIDVVTRTTQGLSVGCARCHDHKFDPIPMRDYYSLYGVFAGCTERIVPLTGEPEKKTPEYIAYAAELKKRTDKFNDTFAKKCEEVAERARVRSVEYLQAVLTAEKLPDELFYVNREANDVYPVIVRQWHHYILAQGKSWSRVWGPWHELAKLPPERFSLEASLVIARMEDERLRYTNRHVLEALRATPPGSMQDVATIYGNLLLQADRQWKDQLKADGKSTPLAEGDWEELRQILYTADAPVRVPSGAIADLEYYFDEGTRVQLGKLQFEMEKWHIDAPGATPHAVILEDRPVQTNPRVFRRGNPSTPGEEVPRQYLELIAGPNRKPFQHGSGRPEMAEAIASKDNPLTARVMVNRIWLWHFGGQGLVKTPSDFGLRCDPPTHPDLLDYLAKKFMNNNWSIKKLHREILLSSTYQQSNSGLSTQDSGLRTDPENLLLSHFPAQRLDFESLHDTLLAASGELDLKMGGRPVELFTTPAAKRRAVYGRVDRQFLPGVLRTFDFANPDLHSPQRATTTVPQQALFMMNSPFVIDRARALANRKDVTSIADPAERVERLFQIVYQRRARPNEVQAAQSYLSRAAADAMPEKPKPIATVWEYGTGDFDPTTGKIRSFSKLPQFTGSAWQGGGSYPDEKLGWAQLTADGGHAGNDPQHAVIRRWISPIDGAVSITGSIGHVHKEGHGILARIVTSRYGELASWRVHNQRAQATIDPIGVKKGDMIDFVVSIRESLNNNDFIWSPVIKSADPKSEWNAKKDFAGPPAPPPEPLTAWEKYAQVLLMSDEMIFVD